MLQLLVEIDVRAYRYTIHGAQFAADLDLARSAGECGSTSVIFSLPESSYVGAIEAEPELANHRRGPFPPASGSGYAGVGRVELADHHAARCGAFRPGVRRAFDQRSVSLADGVPVGAVIFAGRHSRRAAPPRLVRKRPFFPG